MSLKMANLRPEIKKGQDTEPTYITPRYYEGTKKEREDGQIALCGNGKCFAHLRTRSHPGPKEYFETDAKYAESKGRSVLKKLREKEREGEKQSKNIEKQSRSSISAWSKFLKSK